MDDRDKNQKSLVPTTDKRIKSLADVLNKGIGNGRIAEAIRNLRKVDPTLTRVVPTLQHVQRSTQPIYRVPLAAAGPHEQTDLHSDSENEITHWHRVRNVARSRLEKNLLARGGEFCKGTSTAPAQKGESSISDDAIMDPYSIGTQTERKTMETDPLDPSKKAWQTNLKSNKPAKRKTVSVQIDMDAPIKKSLFKRSRSLTPTRYRASSQPPESKHELTAGTENYAINSDNALPVNANHVSDAREENEQRKLSKKSSKALGDPAKNETRLARRRSDPDGNKRHQAASKDQKTSKVTRQKSPLDRDRFQASGQERKSLIKPETDRAGKLDTDPRKKTKRVLSDGNLDKAKISEKDQAAERKLASMKKLAGSDYTQKPKANREEGSSKSSRRRSAKRHHKERDEKTRETRQSKSNITGTGAKDKDAEKGLDEKGQDKEGASENVEKDQAVKRDLEKQEADTTDQMVADHDEEILVDKTVPFDDGRDEAPKGDDPDVDMMEELLGQLQAEGEDRPADLDPEMVKRTEDQIFTKIKFYKDVLHHVKEKTWVMRKRMKLLSEAKEYTSRFEGKLSGGGSGPGQIALLKAKYSKMSRELSNYIALLIPWEGRIKQIQSYFGSVVASYFTFLRWVFWTNIVQAVIAGGIIIVPEIVFGPDWGTVDYKTVPANETESAGYFTSVWNFEGYLEYSPLFYGYYSSIQKFDSGFHMPLGYLVANLAVFGYSFVAILRQIAANSKDEKATDKDDNYRFSWTAFASWDYMIGNHETAKNKYKAIVLAVRESITEIKEAKKKISKKTKFLRVLANFLVLLVLGSSTYAIQVTVKRSMDFEKIKRDGGTLSVWQQNEISVVMSLATSLFPILFDLIAKIEDYHPRVALRWSLGRILVLYLLNLYTLYIALYQKILGIQAEATIANSTWYEQFNGTDVVFCNDAQVILTPIITESILNQTTNLTAAGDTQPCQEEFIADTVCWENMVGQELFKLTVFDMVTTIGLIYATEFFRAILLRVFNRCWCWDLEKLLPKYAEFSLAENLLHLVYNQGMIWMGTLFSPALPAFNLLKLLAMFYVRAWAVMVCNIPEERIFKAGSDNFYLMILLFMLYVVMIPVAFAMVSIRPSQICGPFARIDFMYLALTEWMESVMPPKFYNGVVYLSSPGALIPIFVLIFLILYYLKSSNSALKGAVMDLKKQLLYERTEGKKKVFNMSMAKSEEKSAGKAKMVTSQSRVSLLGSQQNQTMGTPRKTRTNDNNSDPSDKLYSLIKATTFLAKLKTHRAKTIAAAKNNDSAHLV